MLSRVAAVKAPRTHNRRGVTGSSGRRREGGESEPQRPNMSRHLFYSAVLLLVVMVGCGSGAAQVVVVPSHRPLFQWRGINEGGGESVESLGVPSLLKVGNDVFAVAEAQCKKNGVGFTGVASQLLTPQTADTPEEVLKKPKDETQVLEEDVSQKKKLDVSRPTTAVKGSDIYMLVGAYNEVAASGEDDVSDTELGLLLVKKSVNTEDASNKKIDWKDTESSLQVVDAQSDSWTRLIGSGGSGVKMKDETLVFPVEGTKKAVGTEGDVKTVSLVIYSSDNTNLKLSKGMSDGGCSVPSVVEWEEGKLIMMTACDDGRRRVYESGDKGDSWTEALGTLSRVWGNNKKEGKGKAVRNGFITATVGNDGDKRNVMLVTLPVYAEKDSNEKGKLHLWLTDNTHIVDIGPVSGDDDDVAASSLLYNSGENTDEKDDELIALYEKKKDGEKQSPGMVSVLLTEQLQRVKEVPTTWKEVDGRVSKLCTSLSAQRHRSPGDVCSAVKITDGLVGFLSGNFSENTWRDEYLGVNATVKGNDGATKTSDGVKFTGAWAEWPVGSQGENQLYHFANYNFTLVATVSIHNVPREGDTPIPLVGVKMNGDENNVLLGLSYDSGKKWHVLCGDKTTTEVSSTWETGTPQHVVILLKNGTQGSVYVDGQRVGNGECALGNGGSKEISHFYIGGDGENAANKEVSVTVTNVLLYNRLWDEAEITALNPNKAPTPSPVDAPSQGTAIRSSTGQGKVEPRQSMGSSKGAGSGDSTADGEPTVETREGTDGQKEEIHAQNGDVKAAALSSSLGNVSRGNNSDAGSVCGSGLLPLLLLLLGLWGFAAL
ncbi:trans-sialidase [Trypanosoma cruzi cruzi]|uniref:Putative trans-sialidase, Group V n=1 Tax=Trypanosoma cruzi TaxID=5693 RepID=A0A2V2UU70_TRYCR|nr:trans-sialidase [Trypanosoma cruzi cruzi]PWU87610.1 putative trans-sialidase, Group V [Trypanosoma cruzi]